MRLHKQFKYTGVGIALRKSSSISNAKIKALILLLLAGGEKLLYCDGDGALEQATQRACGISFPRDFQNPHECLHTGLACCE